MQHYLLVQNEKHLEKIEKHLRKYINVNQPAWVLTDGSFEKLQFPKFKSKVKSYYVTTLMLTNNNYPNILKDIGGGYFDYLILLSLSNNSILSVQLLGYFNAPCLQGLILDRNLLINLRGLRKFVRKGLKTLELQMNHIKDLSQLVQFDCSTLKYLNLSNNQNVGNLIPYMKAFMSPQVLSLSKPLLNKIKWDLLDQLQRKNSLIPEEDGPRTAVYPKLRSETICYLNLVNSMTQAAIADTWGYINEVLDLQCGDFHIKKLSTRKWYLQAFSILFPFLGQEWNKISSQIQSEQAALDRILLILAQEGVIPQDYLSEIKGRNIVIADQQTIVAMIELIKELVEQALQQAQQEGQEGEEGQEEEAHQDEQVENHQQYEEKQLSYNRNEPKEQLPFTKNKMVVTTIKADSQPDLDRERNIHSVQGIGNEFQDEQLQGSGTDEAENSVNQPPKGYNIFPQANSNSSKPLKVTNYKNEEEDEQDNYLNQKLLKCKSEQKLKNLPVPKGKGKKDKKVRALVAHPPIKKEYNKATTQAQKKLTSTVKNVISGSRKVFDKQNIGLKSPTGKDHLDRKKRQLNYFTSASKGTHHPKREQVKDKSMTKLKKLLKWKQANLKRQQRQLQQDIEMKVQLKKQTYVKKINKLILKLQKQKMLDRKKEERQRHRQQRQLAQKRLQAIEQQYRDQMSLLHSKSPESKKAVAHLDHKAIIQSLQRDLKKQNEKQINMLKMKLRRQEAQLDDDLQTLQKEIVKAYKRN